LVEREVVGKAEIAAVAS